MAEPEVFDMRKELTKKKILSVLNPNLELQGDIYNVKLYSCDKEGKNWLYSDVEGYLGLIIDYQIKTKYLVIYDSTSIEKIFQYELYNNFLKSYEELAQEFRSFEIDSGFMGFQFETKEDAITFDLVIKRLSGLTNDLFAKPRTKEDLKSKEKLAQLYCKKLKEVFGSEDKYDENYAEDGTTILKHNNFKILNNIEYNKETKQFNFGKISDELKEMFVSFGIKRKELERDADYAFTIFKNVIVGLGNENALKNSVVSNIEHNFPPPEEREIIRRKEEAAEAKLNSIKVKRTRKETTQRKVNKPINKPQPQKVKQTTPTPTPTPKSGKAGAPPPPPPPPPPPSVPGVVPTAVPKVPANNQKSEPEPKQESSLQDELNKRRQGLRKVDPNPSNDKVIQGDKMIQGSGKNFLQNALSTAIRNRRNNLHMHDDEDDEEEDDWD